MAFNSNKTTAWDRTTLNDGILFNDEFNNLYDNLVDVDGRVVNLGNSLSALTQYAYTLVAGTIQGGLYWDKTGGGSGAMVLSGGRYEVLGKIITQNSDITLSPVTHVYGNDQWEDNYWYYTLMDTGGALRSQLAGGASVLTGLEVNSLASQGGGVIQVSFRNSPDLSGVSVGMIFRSDDLGAGNSGLFTVTAVDAGTFSIQIGNNRGSMLSAGTEPVGTGAVYASVPGLNTPDPEFSISRQGYYDGDWRILGIDYYDSTQEYRSVRPYKSGYDRNDNELYLHYFDRFGATNTYIPQFKNLHFEWGNDYTLDQSDGASLTFHRSGEVNVMMEYWGSIASNNNIWYGVSRNATALERQGTITNVDRSRLLGHVHVNQSEHSSLTVSATVSRGDVLWAHTSSLIPGEPYNQNCAFRLRFTPE